MVRVYTHVAAYVHLMRGEHDDQLQWPFEGDVYIELLNWREDKKHLVEIFDFNRLIDEDNDICIHVTKTEIGMRL